MWSYCLALYFLKWLLDTYMISFQQARASSACFQALEFLFPGHTKSLRRSEKNSGACTILLLDLACSKWVLWYLNNVLWAALEKQCSFTGATILSSFHTQTLRGNKNNSGACTILLLDLACGKQVLWYLNNVLWAALEKQCSFTGATILSNFHTKPLRGKVGRNTKNSEPYSLTVPGLSRHIQDL